MADKMRPKSLKMLNESYSSTTKNILLVLKIKIKTSLKSYGRYSITVSRFGEARHNIRIYCFRH